jgi:putative PIN family toxin of toxin-antitoxin system
VIRVVLDANVLAPGFAYRQLSAATRLIDLWRQEFYELVISEHLLQELIRTYSDTYYRRFVTPEQVDRFEFLLRRDAVMTELIVPVFGVATQPKDDLILSTGISAGATYLATRDRQLLKLGSYKGMQILHPADLVDLLLQARDPFEEP